MAAHRHHTTSLARKQITCFTWILIIRVQQFHCDYTRTPQSENASVGYQLDKQRLSGAQRHRQVIIDRQRRPRRAVRALLPSHIVHQPRRLLYQSNYQPAARRQVAHMLDGTRLVPMEQDPSSQA